MRGYQAVAAAAVTCACSLGFSAHGASPGEKSVAEAVQTYPDRPIRLMAPFVPHAELVKAPNDPDVKQPFANVRMDTVASSPSEFGAYIKSESEKWAKVIRTVGVKAD